MNVIASILIFFGIVTVRDGKTVFFPNPALTDEQAALCAEVAGDFLGLDREFSSGKNEDGALVYTWGQVDGDLTQAGLVPYVAFFATSEEMITVSESSAEPHDDYMGTVASAMEGVAYMQWWAPETADTFSISLEYWDTSSYHVVTTLEADAIAVGAKGTSPDGVDWKIAGIEQEDGRVLVSVETAKGPRGHSFAFSLATKESPDPQPDSPWPDRSDDGKTLTYSTSCWVGDDDELALFEIRERHPDRAKHWEIKDHSLQQKE